MSVHAVPPLAPGEGRGEGELVVKDRWWQTKGMERGLAVPWPIGYAIRRRVAGANGRSGSESQSKHSMANRARISRSDVKRYQRTLGFGTAGCGRHLALRREVERKPRSDMFTFLGPAAPRGSIGNRAEAVPA